MGGGEDEVAQPFWAAAAGLLNDVALPQLISVVTLALGFKLLLRFARGKSSWVAAISLALLGSYFVWPHIAFLWAHIQHPQRYPLATIFFTPAPGTSSVGDIAFFFIMLIYAPITSNQNSLWLIILVLPVAIAAKSRNREIRWFGYLCIAMFLPAAWFLDSFNQGSFLD